jgi:hypothetical protein
MPKNAWMEYDPEPLKLVVVPETLTQVLPPYPDE